MGWERGLTSMLRHTICLLVLGSFAFLACSDDADPSSEPGRSTSKKKDAGAGGSSGSSGDPQNLPPAPSDPGAFCKAFVDAYLSSVTTCCPSDLDSPPFKFLEAFQDLLLPQCTDRLTKSLADGRIAYEPEKASSCIGSMTVTKDQCPATGPGTAMRSPDCELAYRGLVAEGGTCDGDIECADGLACQGTICKRAATTAGAACAHPDGDADPGIFEARKRCVDGEICFGDDVCAPRSKTGEKCFFRSDCVDGDTCVGDDLADKTCQPIVKQDVGGDCEDDESCNDGLSCQLGKCATRKNAGESCVDKTVNGTECKGYCDGATDTTPGTCHTFCGSQ